MLHTAPKMRSHTQCSMGQSLSSVGEMIFWMHSRTWLAILATYACCWLMLSLLSTCIMLTSTLTVSTMWLGELKLVDQSLPKLCRILDSDVSRQRVPDSSSYFAKVCYHILFLSKSKNSNSLEFSLSSSKSIKLKIRALYLDIKISIILKNYIKSSHS